MFWAAALVRSVLPLRRRPAGKEGRLGAVPAARRLQGPRPGRHQSSGVAGSASLPLRLQWGLRRSALGCLRTPGRGLKAGHRPRSHLSRSARRLQGGHTPRSASAGHPSSPTSTQAPAVFGGPLVRLQRVVPAARSAASRSSAPRRPSWIAARPRPVSQLNFVLFEEV
ncbi:hypothetical protein NDU88_002417 [Pleurodeles waltl]|uniref:Uncharacterized protein n=1 Tax=Pleurodeles waltl TaxID=8319 RepID=A0AAV7VED9_PLEWA|nr:hypothetical protein NDU88_002417 [Pleurodeles waltl]